MSNCKKEDYFMLERNIEALLRDKVKEIGGIAYKWVSPGNNGVPDRIVFLPGGRIYFVELKATGRGVTAIQAAVHDRLKRLGFDVLIIDSKEGVLDFLRRVDTQNTM
jgi:hypothetical protein